MTQPVFLISLPRSGSTLLQNMLSASPHVASCTEPWILLPLLNLRNPGITRAAYFHHTAANAINDFVARIPDGEQHFDGATSRFALDLYESAARGRRYFLDKSPRYYLLVPKLRQLFPDARLILLVRHPLAVLASIAQTFNKGRFRWFDYWIDWIEGHRCMADAIRHSDEASRLVHYEDLVRTPAKTIACLCEWLDIPRTDDMISSNDGREKVAGKMGDKRGLTQGEGISPEPMERWRDFFPTNHRKAVARRMIDRLNPADLSTLGYPTDHLLQDLADIPTRDSVDISGRLDSLANWLAYHCDFRYIQARYRASRTGDKYAYGFYRRD